MNSKNIQNTSNQTDKLDSILNQSEISKKTENSCSIEYKE